MHVRVMTVGFAVMLTSCALDAQRAAPDCSRRIRTPGGAPDVLRAPPEGPLTQLPVRCGNARCLNVVGNALAVVQPDRTVWATWQGQPGTVLQGPNAKDGAALAPSAGSPQLDRWLAEALAPVAPPTATPLPPALPPEFRTCGITTAGGGHGWHVILNDGSVWQRIHWSRPPTSPQVRALPPNAYPAANNAGALCAYGIQTQPRAWDIHLANSGQVITAAPDREHAPARCLPDDVVEVDGAEGRRRFSASGLELPVPDEDGTGTSPAVDYAGQTVLPPRVNRLEVRLPDGTNVVRALPVDGKDLAGNLVEAGATRARVATVGNGRGQLLVAERFTLKGCNVMEALHVLHLTEDRVTTLRRGNHVFHRLQAVDGVFYVLQSAPRVVDLDNPGATPVEL